MSALRCIHKGLNLSSNVIDRLRQQHTQKLLQEKKLILILDLDNTLLHTTDVSNLSAEEEYLLELGDSVESIFSWDGSLTKLRPYARTFLKEASKMYDMYIYTMGSRSYALQMAKFLDPEGIYFETKILSREDSTQPKKKGLDVVLGEERVAVILDDNESVWPRNLTNLISIEGYYFFGSRRPLFDLDGRPLSGLEEAETELGGVLAIALRVLRRVHQSFFDQSADFWNCDVREVMLKIGDEIL